METSQRNEVLQTGDYSPEERRRHHGTNHLGLHSPKFRPLPDRTNIVLTSRPMTDAPEEVVVARSFDEALTKCPEDSTVYVIGGSQVYKTALVHEHTKAVLLTEITCPDGHVECDTFFEGFDQGLWKKQPYERLQDFVGDKVELPGRDTPVEEKGFSFVYTLWEK